MKSYKVTEGYGVCGPSTEIEITTTTLLSCSAIIMFNKRTRSLGLYHYSASTLAAPGVQKAIVRMLNDIEPTEIVVWTAKPDETYRDTVPLAKKMVRLDNSNLKLFLEQMKHSSSTLKVVFDETFPGVKFDGTALDFEGGIDGDTVVPGSATIDEDATETRKQSGNIWFYFGSDAGYEKYAAQLAKSAEAILLAELG